MLLHKIVALVKESACLARITAQDRCTCKGIAAPRPCFCTRSLHL